MNLQTFIIHVFLLIAWRRRTKTPSRLLLPSPSGSWSPGAAWRPRRTPGRRGCSSAGCTSLRAAAAAAGTGPGGGNTHLTEALRTGGVSGPEAEGNTAGPCRAPARARPLTAPCGLAARQGGGASARLAPVSAVWLFCSETTPAGRRRGGGVSSDYYLSY